MPMITLQTSDDEVFETDIEIAKRCGTIKNMLAVLGVNEADERNSIPVPLPKVTSTTLRKVLEWVAHHKDDAPPSGEDKHNGKKANNISAWDADYLKVGRSTLYELIAAANYLDISDLLDVACKTIANMLKGKSVAEICRIFGARKESTAAESEQVRNSLSGSNMLNAADEE